MGFKAAENLSGIQGFVTPNSQAADEDAPIGFQPLDPGTLLGVSDISVASLQDSIRATTLQERAIADFSRAIQLDPGFANAYRDRALAYTMLGKDPEASADVARAVELGVDSNSLNNAIKEVKRLR